MNIDKLPKWARDHIRKLEGERNEAVKALNHYLDSQTNAPFFYDELLSLGEGKGPSFKRRYVQTHKIEAEHGGVSLRILLRDANSMSHRRPCIELSWGVPGRDLDDVIFQPSGHQQARLIAAQEI